MTHFACWHQALGLMNQRSCCAPLVSCHLREARLVQHLSVHGSCMQTLRQVQPCREHRGGSIGTARNGCSACKSASQACMR
jgi:hypothetical protein